MTNRVLIGVLVILVLLAVGYGAFVLQNPQTYTDVNHGITFVVPKGWTVDINQTSSLVSVRSPDFKLKDPSTLPQNMGDETNIIESGASISVRTEPVAESIKDADAYVAFWRPTVRDCANCSDIQDITVGGGPALMYRIKSQDSYYSLDVQTAHNGKNLEVNMGSAMLTEEQEALFNAFVSSIRFVN